MKEMKFRIVFQHIGFMPGKDISDKALEKAHEQYVLMYDKFTKCSNPLLKRINNNWTEYEMAKLHFDEESIKAMRKVMRIDETYDRNKWLADFYEKICKLVDQSCCMYGLKSKIFRDTDGAPHYGVTFRRNPNWSMYMTIEEI